MSDEHKHNCTSNTDACFQTFIGCNVKGFLRDAISGHSRGTKTMVFECGWALTIASNGSFWVENPEDVKRAISRAKDALQQTQRNLKGILELSGSRS